jgi:hypothetical protein
MGQSLKGGVNNCIHPGFPHSHNDELNESTELMGFMSIFYCFYTRYVLQ